MKEAVVRLIIFLFMVFLVAGCGSGGGRSTEEPTELPAGGGNIAPGDESMPERPVDEPAIGTPAPEPSGPSAAGGPAAPKERSGVKIHTLEANPALIQPEESVVLTVSADDDTGGALTYTWKTDFGSLSATNTNPVTWTASSITGIVSIQVEVMNEAGSKATASARIEVWIPPFHPILNSVTPTETKIGEVIHIMGTGLGSSQGSSYLLVGGIASRIESWNDTEIRAIVPTGATTGSVKLVFGDTGSNPVNVMVLWTKENPENAAISAPVDSLSLPELVPDGSGGAIIAWEDQSFTESRGVYAQRVNSTGENQWTPGGLRIRAAVGTYFGLVSDASGGAVIIWEENRVETGNRLYAQKVDHAGTLLWSEEGVGVSSIDGTWALPFKVAPDGSGGAIVTWQDRRAGNIDLYAQRIDSTGTVRWAEDGVAITSAAENQIEIQTAADGLGGAIITWMDYRSENWDVYVQRINGSGEVQWMTDGVPIATAAEDHHFPQLISDGSGGVIITWTEVRSRSTDDVYAQRVDHTGLVQWEIGGVPISNASGGQVNPQLTGDGSGGAIIVWQHNPVPFTVSYIYAQRINGSGQVQWMTNGVATSTMTRNLFSPQVTQDGSGGAVIISSNYLNPNSSFFAQRINHAGEVQWDPEGSPISTAPGVKYRGGIIPDSLGGAIFTWRDHRNAASINTVHPDVIYAQGISASGKQ